MRKPFQEFIKEQKLNESGAGEAYYEARGWSKTVIEAVFEESETDRIKFSEGDDVFTGDTAVEVVRKCADFVLGKVDTNSMELDANGDRGLLEISAMENRDGYAPTPSEIANWRVGQDKLWDVVYSFRINKVISEPVQLTNLGL
jgi:hypothetical protein